MSIVDNLDKSYADAWRPEPGGVLVGELVAVDERLGYNDVSYPILTLRRDDGAEFAVHAFHSVLRNEAGKLNPQLGETVAIKYLGKTRTENSRGSYHGYRMVVDRAQSTVNLRKYANGDGERSAPEPDIPIDSADLPPVNTKDTPAPDQTVQARAAEHFGDDASWMS